MSKTVKLISYWPVLPSGGINSELSQYIRHTSPADAAYLASCQEKRNLFAPSASVWMVPGTEDHD